MKHAGGTLTSSNLEGEQLRWQMYNVFRVLAKPEHELRAKALKLRRDVSAKWCIQAAQGKWFPWPTTIAPRGARGLKEAGWRPQGMLGYLGYHVGEVQPTPQDIRRSILEYAFEFYLPPLSDPGYYLEWAEPLTAQRLKKLANSLAAFARNAKRRDGFSWAIAIHDWESDLLFLHQKYYLDYFQFGWPATEAMRERPTRSSQSSSSISGLALMVDVERPGELHSAIGHEAKAPTVA